MRISLDNYLNEVIDVNDMGDLATILGLQVLYRYHRKSKKLTGKIAGLSMKTGTVYVEWADKTNQWVCLQSVEVII